MRTLTVFRESVSIKSSIIRQQGYLKGHLNVALSTALSHNYSKIASFYGDRFPWVGSCHIKFAT